MKLFASIRKDEWGEIIIAMVKAEDRVEAIRLLEESDMWEGHLLQILPNTQFEKDMEPGWVYYDL